MKITEEMSDEELMINYQNGDYQSFELLFKRHSGRLLNYYKKRIDESQAEDLFQDFFQKLHKFRLKYKKEYPFLPWFFLLARHVYIDFMRNKDNKVFRSEKIEVFDENFLDNRDSSASLHETLEQALEMLSEKERELLLKRYLKDWSFSKIAIDLNATESSARKMLSRGLKRLRVLLSKNGEGV